MLPKDPSDHTRRLTRMKTMITLMIYLKHKQQKEEVHARVSQLRRSDLGTNRRFTRLKYTPRHLSRKLRSAISSIKLSCSLHSTKMIKIS